VVKGGDEKWDEERLNNYEIEFGNCVNWIQVLDLAYSGCNFTRCNRREEGSFVAKKLDWVLVNEAWLDEFSKSEVEFQEAGISDHSPAIVSMGKFQSSGPKPFKLFGFWAENDKFFDWIEEGWNINVEGVPLYHLCMKLRSVKKVLKK
jgi:hypothetical protein